MHPKRRAGTAAAACAALLAALGMASPAHASADQQRQSLEVLRDTVINLLQTLVQRGVITRQQAEQLVKRAQDKATAAIAVERAKQRAQREQEEKEGAISVPYVPEIIQRKIAKQVAAQVQPAVTVKVLKAARRQGWGVPGALPDWIRKVRVAGDLTLRGQDDLYGSGNSAGCPQGTPYGNCTILNYNAINAAGGIAQAGVNAFLNINQNQELMRARARLGVRVALTPSIEAGIRLTTGSLDNPISETQTLASEFGRYTTGFDRIYLRWRGRTARGFPYLTAIGGKFANPFYAPTQLVYGRQLELDGAAVTGRLGIGDGGAKQSYLWLTAGGFPIQAVELVAKNDKWMVGGQVGTSLRFGDGQRFTLAAAYYDFVHMQGIPNPPYSTLENYTIPAYVTHGNSMCDIANQTGSSTSVFLFALCSQFHIADLSLGYDLPIGPYTLSVAAEAARNVGFSRSDILRVFGSSYSSVIDTAGRKGYVAEAGFGTPGFYQAWKWRTLLGYRYVQSDAVLDALTDPDFHLGGTNAQGYFVNGELGLADNVWARLAYFSGRQINGPAYAVDVIQLDLNARF